MGLGRAALRGAVLQPHVEKEDEVGRVGRGGVLLLGAPGGRVQRAARTGPGSEPFALDPGAHSEVRPRWSVHPCQGKGLICGGKCG